MSFWGDKEKQTGIIKDNKKLIDTMRKLKTRNRGNNTHLDMANVKCGPGTIITAFEIILLAAKDSELEEEALADAKDAFDFLEEKLSFTRMQSMVVAMLIDSNTVLDTGRMGGYLGIRNIRMLTYMQEIAALVSARIIRVNNDNFESGYQINPKALAAYMNNEAYVPASDKNLSTKRLVERIGEVLKETEDGAITNEQMLEELVALMKSNKNHYLCKRTKTLEPREAALFFFCLDKYIGEGDLNICDHEFSSMFSRSDFRALCNAVAARRGDLFKEKLLGEPQSEGFSPRENIAISDEVREYIDQELGISWEAPEKDHRAGLLTYDTITEKPLFYNSEERISIGKLQEMLGQEAFLGIQERMKEGGMRTGFACLFYGAPGTGKTETVLQLARSTGRDIMQVNVTDIKNKYVGESEKNIRNIFRRYRSYCEKCEVKPILLFNEADAIISKRSSDVGRSVDKMENAIQNIILEEIEKLDGILIATTNLATNMDSAFERRFIYKVEFHKPDVATKAHIWKSMIGELSDDDAAVLAGEFDLSGGQIENVMRKQFVDKVLYNEAPSLEKLRLYCKQENLGRCAPNRPRVGF